jgi:hypothetical protein
VCPETRVLRDLEPSSKVQQRSREWSGGHSTGVPNEARLARSIYTRPLT